MMKEHVRSFLIPRQVLLVLLALSMQAHAAVASKDVAPARKQASAFYPPALIQKAKANTEKYPWAAKMQKDIVRAAEPWMKFSDDELWGLMFGNTIPRSWMVWSDGHCPSCKRDVKMYSWKINAMGEPWKLRCPHCNEAFPKNDFYKYYRSGLDARGIFDPKLADRKLLFNTEYPDPRHPLHKFGVDDGDGFVQDGKRWRFVGAYIARGQWKQVVLEGIKRLAAAYVATGDPIYAHKAGILLDRVADLYPTFDFQTQGFVYDRQRDTGYVTPWHDARIETSTIVMAYDLIFDALRDDEKLVSFLARKARLYNTENTKHSFEDIQKNIEERILRDALKNRSKIKSGYQPLVDLATTIIEAVLEWPDNRPYILAQVGSLTEAFSAVDGVTGVKGMADYSPYGLQFMAVLYAQFGRLDAEILRELLNSHPSIQQMFRFHIDTWCLHSYYPLTGDTAWFARKIDRYAGVSFSRSAGVEPSMYSLFWRLYELTGDPAFVQVLYLGNSNSIDGLPHDLFAEDPAAFQKDVLKVISQHDALPQVGSVNKEQYHLAILRAGRGSNARAMWLDYDSGGEHGHFDGMNLGLFAKGLDLLPDFGYPPVQYGGWASPQAKWYTMTAAHNTVVVDGENHQRTAGKTTLWADGKQFQAVRASGPELIKGEQYERTAAMVEISAEDFYILDLFRVVGGKEHDKFLHSHFGQITTQGLNLQPGGDYGRGTLMRNFRTDRAARPGWSIDWKIEDRYGYLPPGSDVHLRYTDLTPDAEVSTAEGWVVTGFYNSSEEAWIPRVLVRRTSDAEPLASTFVGVIEPYEKRSNIAEIRRLALKTPGGTEYPEANVAVEVRLADGRSDLFISADVENPLEHSPSRKEQRFLLQEDWNLLLDGELCLVRRGKTGEVQRVILCNATSADIGEVKIQLRPNTEFIEISFVRGRPWVVAGNPEDLVQ